MTSRSLDGRPQQATFGNGLVTQYLYHATSGNLDEIRTGPVGTSSVQKFHFDFSAIGNLSYRADANAGVGERLTGKDFDSIYTTNTARAQRGAPPFRAIMVPQSGPAVLYSEIRLETLRVSRKGRIRASDPQRIDITMDFP